jgi:omega-6 fatty acid desaturase (delta-12 desaturase)
MQKKRESRPARDVIRATIPFAREERRRSWWHLVSTLVLLVGALLATCLPIFWPVRFAVSVFAALLLVRMFVIYHDYLHGAILRRSWLAGAWFKAFGFLTLNPPGIWKRSHDYHHHHNGQYFGTAVGTFPLMTTDEYARAGWWRRLGYAAVRHPIVILLGYFTVFVYGMCLKDFLTSPRQHLDAAGALLLQAGMIAVLAVFAPGMLVFTFMLPILLGSALGAYLFYAQHNFPDAQFQDRARWNYMAAALKSSSYLRMSPVMCWFTGSIGFHHVHHLNSRIPFYRLGEAMAGIKELQSPGTTTLHPRDIWRCLRLKLWDPQRNRLVGFREFHLTNRQWGRA